MLPLLSTIEAPPASPTTSRTAARLNTRSILPRTTKLYDRTSDQGSLDEIERIAI